MGAGAAAKAFNLGVIIISSSRGFAGHDEMGRRLVTCGEEFFVGARDARTRGPSWSFGTALKPMASS
jgi:hypothetical protein